MDRRNFLGGVALAGLALPFAGIAGAIAARPAAGRTSSAQASSSAAKREMRMNKAPYDSVGSGVSTGK